LSLQCVTPVIIGPGETWLDTQSCRVVLDSILVFFHLVVGDPSVVVEESIAGLVVYGDRVVEDGLFVLFEVVVSKTSVIVGTGIFAV
jgi:methenyltetrahydromethanopterin cyclohydrolase